MPTNGVEAIIDTRDYETHPYLVMFTKYGQVKKTKFSDYDSRNTVLIAIKLQDDDEVVAVRATGGDNDLVMFTQNGQGIRFSEEDVRPMGRDTQGVRGVKLRDGDKVVAAAGVADGDDIVLLTSGGYGKRILTTSDSGNTWTEGNLGINHRMQDIDLINNNSGYAVGRQGVIYKTKGSSVTPVNNIYMHPSVMGSINSFTDKSGCTVDWDCVNDQSSNLASGLPEAVNSNDYVADGNGNRVMFALEDGFITTNQQVTKICLSIAATQFTGPRASLSYQRSGIDLQPIDSVVFWIGSYWYNGMTTHCWSNLNWTSKDIDALEIGVKSVEGNWIEISQMYVKVFVLTP